MKTHGSQPYNIGQSLLYRKGNQLHPVTFVSLGPRVAKGVGRDAVTSEPQSAIVRDASGDLMTVRLSDLQPAPRNDKTKT